MDFLAFGWTFVFAAWAIFIGSAIGVLGMTPPRPQLAKLFFLAAGISLGVMAVMFGITVPVSLTLRIVGAFLIGGLAASITTGAYVWVNGLPKPAPQNQGSLVAGDDAKTLLSTKDGVYPIIEIGTKGAKLAKIGDPKQPLFSFFGDLDILVERKGGKTLISTEIRDQSGQLIATLRRNEWAVAPPPKTWDKNYNSDSLEVIDNYGKVVLQVRSFPDRVQLQGIWWSSDPGNGVELFEDPATGGGSILIKTPQNNARFIPIKRRFTYPSALHFGELEKAD